MTRQDRDQLRAYFGSPEGRRVLDEINRVYYARHRIASLPDTFWRDSLTGERLGIPDDVEAASADPINPLRTFPAPPTPEEVARVASLNRAMLVTWIFCTVVLGAWLVWVIATTIRSYS